jgi:hypothetical protein
MVRPPQVPEVVSFTVTVKLQELDRLQVPIA